MIFDPSVWSRGDVTFDEPVALSGHDVSQEKRDESGKWVHGARAAAANAKYAELLAQAKQHRIDAFNAVKTDAEEAMGKANGYAESLYTDSRELIWDSDDAGQAAYTDLESLIGDYDEDASASDRFASLKEIEEKAAEALDVEMPHDVLTAEQKQTQKQISELDKSVEAARVRRNELYNGLSAIKQVTRPEITGNKKPAQDYIAKTSKEWDGLDQQIKDAETKQAELAKSLPSGFTSDDIASNKKHLKAVIASARAARQHLKAYVAHRKEMQAIKSGESPDVQLSMAMPDDWDEISLSVALLEAPAEVSEHEVAATELAEAIIGRAKAAGIAISSEIRRAALKMMAGLMKQELPPAAFLDNFLRGFRDILRRYEPVLARTISDAHLAAWLKGGAGVTKLLPAIPPPEIPRWTTLQQPDDAEPIIRFPIIDAAAADLAARALLDPGEFYAQHQLGRMTGFSIANVASLETIERIRDGLTEAIVQGQTFRTWQKRFETEFDESQLSEQRQELIFRNALNTSYARGQKAVVQSPLVSSVAVFAWRVEIPDSRLTPLCHHLSHSGLQGTSIFCTADPVWRKVAPISHHACRCGTIYLSAKRAAKKGIEVAKKWIRDGERPSDAELFVPPIVIPENLLSPSGLAAWESWVSPWA